MLYCSILLKNLKINMIACSILKLTHSKRFIPRLIAPYTSKVLKLRGLNQSTLMPVLKMAHTSTCPTNYKKPTSDCNDTSLGLVLKRALKSGKVRMGLIPDEWFLFFHTKTGVTGPYLFGIVLVNYLFSKEIYVMDHEYYTALSILPIMYYASTKFGPELGKSLDQKVEAFANVLEKGRNDEKRVFEDIIKDAKDAQWRAQSQAILIDAKKENIAMQLEAMYRERIMQVFVAVKARLDYQVKLHRALTRIHQKCMIQWIIDNVIESITPEFEKEYLDKAIQDIASAADRVK